MCKNKVLAHNENGYVLLCKTCNHVQIGFGTTAACMSEQQYVDFKIQSEKELDRIKNEDLPFQKSIALSTFSKNVFMVLNNLELKQLQELLDEACCMLQLEKIMNDSHICLMNHN